MNTIYEKLERVRKPRVHIKYEVETENAIEKKELPFVVGVMGDFAADSIESQKPLAERKFIQIDQDNFNTVMAHIKPKLNIKVQNTLQDELNAPDQQNKQDEQNEIAITLQFNCMEDFAPEKIVAQIPALQNLLAKRNKLRDLLIKIDRSAKLEDILEHVLQDSQGLQKIMGELENANKN